MMYKLYLKKVIKPKIALELRTFVISDIIVYLNLESSTEEIF